MELQCRWCNTPISTPLLVEKKTGEVYQYQACDMDCVKDMDRTDKSDEKLNLYEKLNKPENYYRKELLSDDGDEEEQEDYSEVELTFDDIKLGEEEEPELRF